MTLERFFRRVVADLTERKVMFALAGGLLASCYRQSPRATNDLDLVILSGGTEEHVAEELIRSFGLEPHALRQAQLEGGPMFAIKRKSTPVQILAGRPASKDPDIIGLDILLPTLPWVEQACTRAQDNRIDFGFGPVPCLTVEDLIVSKLYAVRNQATRFMDLDDLKSIFEADHRLSLDSLGGSIQALGLSIPEALRPFVPPALRRLLKSLSR